MIEFFIKDKEPQDFFCILKEIVYPVLKKDPLWHFFGEGELGLIVRCSDNFEQKLWKEFVKNDMHPSFYEWNNDHKIVTEHWEYMKKIFHLNSEFAMEHVLDEYSFSMFEDRMVHSLYNNLAEVAQGWDMRRESNVLATMLVNRATYTGMRIRYLQELESHGKNGDAGTPDT